MDLTAGRRLVERWRAGTAGSGNGTGPSPLLPTQRGIWFMEQLHPNTPMHNMHFAGRHAGPLDRARLDAAVAAVVRRHPLLRTTFHGDAADAVQEVRDELPVTPRWTDLRDRPYGERDETARRLAAGEVARMFDLGHEPPVRIHVYRLADEEHLVLLVAHHLVCDGSSLRIVLDDLDTAYGAGELPGTVSVPTFEPVDPQEMAYWRSRLADLPDLDLPSDQARPAQPTFRAGSIPLTIPVEVLTSAERICREENVTLFTVVLAAFEVLLERHSGQVDFAVGTMDAGRARAGRRDVVGLLANPIVLRADLSGGPTFRELVRRAQATCLDAFEHRNAPFDDLVIELAGARAAGRAPLFQAYLVFHSERGMPRLAGSTLEPVVVPRPALRHDVELHLWHGDGGMGGSWDYAVDAFDEATARRMAERFGILLASAVADPDRVAASLDVHTAEDERLLGRWVDVPPSTDPPSVLPELFVEQAARTPETVAVTDGKRELTYRQLDVRSSQVAHHLRGRAVGPGDVVGIRMARTVDLAVAMLGVLKAGAAYLPLDPAYPAERLEFTVADVGVRVVLTDLAALDGLDGEPESAVADVDLRAHDLAYVLYTSGSTGRPKGVLLDHGNAVALVRWGIGAYTRAQLSRVLASTSIGFDVSVPEFFVTLSAGGTVVMVDDTLALLSSERPDVTFLNVVPTVARELVTSGVSLDGVKVVNLVGEPVPAGLVDDMQEVGDFELVLNAYGPTETTTYSTTAALVPGDDLLPIGRPLPHERVYVLDGEMRLVPFGAIGELYLAGAGLARGYHNGQALTASRFVADPYSPVPGQRMYRTGDRVRYRYDGELVYLGRSDFQVKIRGQRIEPGEIEATLQRHPSVSDAAVVAHDGRLVGYLTAKQPKEGVDTEEVRAFLRARLPEVMVPSVLMVLDTLPHTTSGKTDRRALPLPSSGGAGEPPRGAAEELVAEVWREVLEVQLVSREDNFFDIGGDSLVANRVLTRLAEHTGLKVPLRTLFDRPGLAELAAVLPADLPDGAPREQLRNAGNGVLPRARRHQGPEGTWVAAASPGQERLWFLAQLDPLADRANVIQGALRLTGPLRVDLLDEALGAVTTRQETLRTTFREVEERLELVIHPDARLRLELVDVAGVDEVHALAEEACASLDLTAGPLTRVHLARIGDEEHVLLLTVHHIIADGWSLAVLCDEISQAYTALLDGRRPELPQPDVEYADYASWLNGELTGGALREQLSYWRERLDGLTRFELRTDKARQARPPRRGSVVRRQVPAEVVGELQALATRESATPYMVLLAAYLVLLRRHGDQPDIPVGTPVAGRSRSELERLIGFFVNTVVVRAEVRDDDAFTDLLARVRAATLGALANQDVPLQAVLAELRVAREPNRTPVFDAIFNYLNQPDARFDVPGLTAEELAPQRPLARFDLELHVEEADDGGVGLVLCYSQDLFEPDTACAMLEWYVQLLRQLAGDARRRIGELRGLPEELAARAGTD